MRLPHRSHVAHTPGFRIDRRHGAATLLGVAVFALLLLVVPGTVNALDGQSMLRVTQSLVERGDAAVSGPLYGVPGLHGQYYSKYGPGQSLAAVPFYLVGRAVAPLVPARYRPELPEMAASLVPVVATAVAAALLMLTAQALGVAPRRALLLALVYVFATPAAAYATQWFSEPLTACALLAAVYLLVRDRCTTARWRQALAGVALVVAVSTRLETLLLVPPLALYALMGPSRGYRDAAVLLSPLVVAIVGLGLYNAARFGSPLETGYSMGDAFAYRDTHPARTLGAFVEGVYGLLFSPGKGLVEYAPVVVLAPLGAVTLLVRRRAETVLLATLFALQLVIHANVVIRWVGGWSWGPRFLLPALPLLVVLVTPLLDRPGRGGRTSGALLVALSLLGVLAQVPALMLDEPHQYIYTLQPRYHALGRTPTIAAMTRLEDAYIYQPDLSPIVGAWRQVREPGTYAPPPDVSPVLVAQKSVTVAPHTWWRLLALQGANPVALAALCACLLITGVACLAAALRLAAPAPDVPSGGDMPRQAGPWASSHA